VPAIAVADELRAEGASVSFIGALARPEAELVPRAGYEIDFLRVQGLDRRNPLRAAIALGRAAPGVLVARRSLRRRDAQAVLGGGGYVGGVAGMAAAGLGLPLVLSEADSHLGLANRLLARRARRVCLAFPIDGREGQPYVVTGRPVPKAVLSADRGRARARFGLDADQPCLLVFGGSQGARSINEAAFAAFAGGRLAFSVLHLAGRRDYPALEERLESQREPGYTLIEYEPNLGDVLAASDLVLARAGGSVFEIAAAGRPAILVPYPHATANHQSHNARWMAEAGAAVVIPDDQLTPGKAVSASGALLSDRELLARMSRASARLARPDAARRIAVELLEAARS
jgi:UDP-N-acetylglucosamine--N-acetylmuramyl-(pentapeptide) pyrophosphoryl-undecaprenol N-acetylglucosamine transferase